MKSSLLRLGSAFAIVALLGGCSSDDTDNGTTGTTGSESTGSSGSTGSSTGGSTTTSTTGSGGTSTGSGTTGSGATSSGTTGSRDGGSAGTGGVTGDGGTKTDAQAEGGPREAGEAGDGGGITFAAVKPIFDRCTGCHSSTRPDGGMKTPSGNLDMVTNGVIAALVGVAANYCMDRKYIDTANPNNSYVLNAVSGTFPPNTSTCTNHSEVDGGMMFRMPPQCVPVGGDGGAVASDASSTDANASADAESSADAVSSVDASSDDASSVDAASATDATSGTDAAGDGGISNPCLTSAQIQLLTDWIAGGAKP